MDTRAPRANTWIEKKRLQIGLEGNEFVSALAYAGNEGWYRVIAERQKRVVVAPTLMGENAMTDNPAYVARNLDDLPKLLAEIFSQCAEGGMVFPFIACAISPNGNVCVFRVEPAGNEILAEHYENEPFRLPMTITVVDQKNEVAVVGIDDGGNIVRH